MSTTADPAASPRAWAWALVLVGVAAALYWPALDVGFLADDVYQLALFDGRAGSRAPWALYSLYPEDPQATAAHVARGSLPWWTVPEFRFVQVRPLSSLLLALDHTLWPRDAAAHHLHSMAWLAATLVAAHRLLRRATSPAIAGLAAFVYAIDETLGWTTAWLANRCAMVSATFAFAALAVHLRADPRGGRRRAALECGLWLLAFAAGEYALCGAAYVVAYEGVGRDGPWRRRLRALLPAAAGLAAFALASVALRAGVHGATSYVDPLAHPGPFLRACLDRIPLMLGEIWLAIPGETERLMVRNEGTPLLRMMAALSTADGPLAVAQGHGRLVMLALVGLGAPLWWLVRRELIPAERRAVAWTALGSLGALVPLAAILPATRALALAALGPAVFVASVGVAALRALRRRPKAFGDHVRGGVISLAALGLLVPHVVLDAIGARVQIAGIGDTGRAYLDFHRTPDVARRVRGGEHVVVIAAPGLVTGLHGQWIMALLDRPRPRSWHALTVGDRRLLLRRADDRTLDLSTFDRAMHDQPQETLFRPPSQALRADDTVGTGLFRARIIREHERRGPAAIQFTFDRSLDDPSLVFMVGDKTGLRSFAVPQIGRAVIVPAPVLPAASREITPSEGR